MSRLRHLVDIKEGNYKPSNSPDKTKILTMRIGNLMEKKLQFFLSTGTGRR
jgi:hypothetical protein